MVRACPVVLAAAMVGFGAVCRRLGSQGCAVRWRDTLGATVYDRAGRTTVWRRACDEDVAVQAESATWDVAAAWSGLVWARDPRPWPARERAALMEEYLRAVADWVVLPPAARWSRIMRPGGDEWPVGLSCPLADAGTLLRYAMGESVCAVAGPRPEVVGRAVLVAVQDPQEHGASPDVVLRVGTPPLAREVVLAPPATSRSLFPGFTIQPLGDGPLLTTGPCWRTLQPRRLRASSAPWAPFSP